MSKFLSELFSLNQKTAAIIGAGGYLCSEMALALAKAGASVAVLDKNKANLKEITAKIKKNNANVIAISLDVTKKESLEKALKKILIKFGALDILINGAGINAPTSFLNISLKEWHSILDTHLTGTFLACQVFGKHMVNKKSGSIINISSASAGPPLSKAFTYSVAKAGIKNLTQNLAREWAPYNVRLNALRPGFFPTKWSMKHFITREREKAILGHTPMKRYGKPEELIGAVLWLASDASSFVTGAEIAVDGGFSCMTI
ncbi:MAG: SDR family oxidoreductase [Candidatus Omnitrophica bacterium]|nr:SDR family oxidoreductase [Candidatus Omnitrophota bacterium]